MNNLEAFIVGAIGGIIVGLFIIVPLVNKIIVKAIYKNR